MMSMIVVLIISLAGIVMMQYSFLFIVMVLLPTIVAFYTDVSQKRSVFQIVGCGNVAAALPTLVPLIKGCLFKRHYDAQGIITDPSVWMIIYMGAAAGWGMIYFCRYISRYVVIMTYEYNITHLQKQQKRLIEEWGEDIEPEPEIDESDEENEDI